MSTIKCPLCLSELEILHAFDFAYANCECCIDNFKFYYSFGTTGHLAKTFVSDKYSIIFKTNHFSKYQKYTVYINNILILSDFTFTNFSTTLFDYLCNKFQYFTVFS